MLSIVTGSFHPELESALVSQVRSLKQDDPLAPAAIIVPSHQLARRVKWLLAVEQGLALLDVYVLTFHQLAVTLIEEGREDRRALADGMLREELLRCLVARGVPGSEAFRDWAKMRGLWGGLWATIQDLKEARVDPSSVLSAIGEKMLGDEDPERMAALIRLYASVLSADRDLRLADPDDLATLAVERIPHSAFLARMRRVCYYGFYDLTQGQLDLFKAVASACPTSVFFPLRRDIPAYRFAQRFSPRSPKSGYSQANKERLRALAKQRKLMPEVLASLQEIIPEDDEFQVPEDILAAIKASPRAWRYFQGFSPAYVRIRISFIEGARKRPEEFKKRLRYFIQMTEKGKQIGFGGIEKHY